MKIMFNPINAVSEVVFLDSISLERQYAGISVWKTGEIKNIPNDLKVREKRNGIVSYVKLVDMLLSEVCFVPVGRPNENFTCQSCRKHTTQEFIVRDNIQIPLESKEGHRLCFECFRTTM
jgi:hypothetical protein